MLTLIALAMAGLSVIYSKEYAGGLLRGNEAYNTLVHGPFVFVRSRCISVSAMATWDSDYLPLVVTNSCITKPSSRWLKNYAVNAQAPIMFSPFM